MDLQSQLQWKRNVKRWLDDLRKVWLPAPGQPEFVVPRARFDAAIGREWTALQRCQVRSC